MKKLFKKAIGAILSISLMLCSFSMPVFAADSSGLEEAILSVKSRIEIPEELTEFDSNIRTADGGDYYDLVWNDKDYNYHISVTINDKGDICEYYTSGGEYDDTVRFAVYSGEELKDKAIKWLEKINPKWVLELDKGSCEDTAGNIYSDRAYISFDRIKNGIKFLNNSVSITLSNRTGEIKSMYSNWSYEEDFPDVSEAMDMTFAGDEFFKLSPIELIYQENGDTANLVYSPKNSYVRINARKGGEITDEYEVYNGNLKAAAVAEETADASGGGSANRLTESELANIEEIEALISEGELIDLAKGLKNTGLDTAEYDSCQYMRGYGYYPRGEEGEKIEYFAQLTFKFNAGTENQYRAIVNFNAETGELVSYNAYNYRRYNDKDGDKPKIKIDDALKTAEQFIGEYSEKQANKIKLEKMPDESQGYSFSFIRYENDIPYYHNNISVDVNSDTGYVEGFYKNWSENVTFENPDGVMTKDEAEEKFRQNVGFELSYVYDYKPSESGESPVKAVELCYTLPRTRGHIINAKTGELVDVYAEQELTLPNDISGHYAEEEILALIKAGVIEIEAETPVYRPDDVITKGELGYLVSRLTHRYYSYEPAQAENRMRSLNILLPDEIFSADEEAVREDGPMYILRAMGYREVAELFDIYKCDFEDSHSIPNEKVGYVSIAKGMKIIKGDEKNCFNAGASLTRADAAIMIYNYLSR